jgi:hypothetical protein
MQFATKTKLRNKYCRSQLFLSKLESLEGILLIMKKQYLQQCSDMWKWFPCLQKCRWLCHFDHPPAIFTIQLTSFWSVTMNLLTIKKCVFLKVFYTFSRPGHFSIASYIKTGPVMNILFMWAVPLSLFNVCLWRLLVGSLLLLLQCHCHSYIQFQYWKWHFPSGKGVEKV